MSHEEIAQHIVTTHNGSDQPGPPLKYKDVYQRIQALVIAYRQPDRMRHLSNLYPYGGVDHLYHVSI
jgi:hypothetical protein